MTTEQQRYFAYMLRLWQVSSDGEPIWRASLESPYTTVYFSLTIRTRSKSLATIVLGKMGSASARTSRSE